MVRTSCPLCSSGEPGPAPNVMINPRGCMHPAQMAVLMAAFFAAYGVHARFLTADPHPLYAIVAWVMAALWLGLAWVSRRGTRP